MTEQVLREVHSEIPLRVLVRLWLVFIHTRVIQHLTLSQWHSRSMEILLTQNTVTAGNVKDYTAHHFSGLYYSPRPLAEL